MRSTLTRALCAIVTAAIVVGSSAGIASADPEVPAATWTDTSNRQAVIDAWTASQADVGPTNAGYAALTDGCSVETPADASYAAAELARLNYYRAQVGVQPVALDPTLSSDAQGAARWLAYTGIGTHYPTIDDMAASAERDACWSDDAEAAQVANIHPGASGRDAIDAYIAEPSGLYNSNDEVGHRRQLLNPDLVNVGIGDGRYNGRNTNATIADINTAAGGSQVREPDGLVAWPTRGYNMVDSLHPRWNASIAPWFSASDFSAATVTVTQAGAPVALTAKPCYLETPSDDIFATDGEWVDRGACPVAASPGHAAAILFTPQVKTPLYGDTTFTVTIDNVAIITDAGTTTVALTYDVIVIAPPKPVEPPKPPTLSPDAAFIDALSRDYLRTPATPQRITYWVTRLRAGWSRARVAQEFAVSNENLNKLVDGYYRNILGRGTTSAQRANWVKKLRAGRTTSSVVGEFYGSAEYFNNNGRSNAAYVRSLYRRILGREGDATQVKNWVTQVNRYGRTRVAVSFYQSTEARNRRVADEFQAILRRNPSGPSIAHWSPQLAKHGNDIRLSRDLAASLEYYQAATKPRG